MKFTATCPYKQGGFDRAEKEELIRKGWLRLFHSTRAPRRLWEGDMKQEMQVVRPRQKHQHAPELGERLGRRGDEALSHEGKAEVFPALKQQVSPLTHRLPVKLEDNSQDAHIL